MEQNAGLEQNIENWIKQGKRGGVLRNFKCHFVRDN